MSWLLVVVVVALSSSRASGQDAYNGGSPLIQVSFDRMIPITYPLVHTNFDRVRPTTYPLIDPGIAQNPITDNLTDSFAQPIVQTFGTSGISASAKTINMAQRRAEPRIQVNTGVRVPTPVPPKLVLPIRASKPVSTPRPKSR